MIQREVTVRNQLGIHARPASLIVGTAKKFQAEVWIEKDGQTADAKSIMGVMMLAAAQNSTVLIRAQGADAREAVDAVALHFDSKFGE